MFKKNTIKNKISRYSRTTKGPRTKRRRLFSLLQHSATTAPTFKNKNTRRKKLLPLLILLSLLFGAVYAVFFSPFFLIRTITVSAYDNSEALPQNIYDLANGALGLNLILINPNKIGDQIRKINPDLETVETRKKLPHSLEFILRFYTQTVNFIVPESPSGLKHKFVLNKIGKISRNNHENPQLPYLILRNVNDEFYDEIMSETVNFNPSLIEKALTAQKLFEEQFNLGVTENNFYKVEREARLKTAKGFTVWFDLNKDIAEQILKLKKAQGKLDLQTEPLLYIDLRIGSQNGEKIIFKRRND